MRSTFGRRVVGATGHELVVIPGDGGNGPARRFTVRSDIKERIWNLLMPRIDPAAAGRLPRSTLKNEIAKLVQEIATEERIELNESEENILATELTDDMIGLGPLGAFPPGYGGP